MSPAAKIGALVLVALGVAGYFIVKIQSVSVGKGEGRRYVVRLAEAQGLADRAPVLLKGVRVGRVTELQLTREGVRVNILIAAEPPLHEGATAQVSSIGLLGEKQLDLKEGDLRRPVLPAGADIQGTVAISLDVVLARLAGIADDVKEVT